MANDMAEEIEWDDEDEQAASAAWTKLDAELRREEAEGKAPSDDDGIPRGDG